MSPAQLTVVARMLRRQGLPCAAGLSGPVVAACACIAPTIATVGTNDPAGLADDMASLRGRPDRGSTTAADARLAGDPPKGFPAVPPATRVPPAPPTLNGVLAAIAPPTPPCVPVTTAAAGGIANERLITGRCTLLVSS